MKKIHLNRAQNGQRKTLFFLAAKKKKLTILFALLCVSMMSWATDYCHTEMTTGGKTIYLTCQEISAGNYQLKVECNEAMSGLGGSFCEVNGVGGYQLNAEGHFTLSGDGKTITCDIASSSAPRVYTPLYVLIDGEKNFGEISDASWAACGGGSTPDPDPDPTPDPDPNSYTAGGHTIHLEAYHVNDIYTLNITSTDNMEGLGGSFWNVNGVGADMRSNSGENSYTVSGDKKTITCQVQSSSAPNIYTPLYVLMPGEVNFGNVTLNWEDRTPITSEYCNYQGPETQQDGHYYAIFFETDPSGNVVITIGNGTGAGACSFRNGGFEGGNNGLDNFVVSDDNFATTTPAADYFTVTRPSDGDLQYVLTKIADLPAGAKIKHLSAGAIAWREAGTDRWCNPEFIYTYGGTCNKLDAPTNVKIDASNILTFDAVAGADSYMAYVSLGGVEKYSQAVVPGAELTYTALVTGDYIINVVASGAGKVDSDPSADVVWHLEAAPVVLGNSEYCEKNMSSGSTEAAFTWETDANGNIVITISEVLNGSNDPAHFRANAFKDGIKVGASKESLSTYFNIPATIAGEDHSQKSLTYTLIDPANAPARGEKIYYHGVVEYRTSENTDAWPTLDFEWTYGTVCSGKSVSASVNNNTMGSAVAKVGEDEVTSVDEGTEVAFIATVADPALYRFVNWTKGGVEVSTNATYVTTITETTNLVANFDYIRESYCHYEVLATGGAAVGKKLYMTLGSIGGGKYQIRFDGSAEAPLTGLQDAAYTINWVKAIKNTEVNPVEGQDVPFTKGNDRWNFNAAGYGCAWIDFELADGKTIDDIFVWNNTITFNIDGGLLVYVDNQDRLGLFGNPAPLRHNIDWDATCSDTEAPAFNKAEAEVLNESSVRLKIQATDNWGGLLTYTIARAGASDIILNGASGEELTQEVTGLTTNTEYDFTITVSDGVNDAVTHIVVTPIADNEKPVMTSASLESKTWNSAIINVTATDNKGVTAYYIAELDAEFVAAEGKITVTGLTAATTYTFHIKAKDAAGNISDNQAEVSFTTDAHLLAPATAAPVPTWPANQVKSLYSNTYDFAPASLSSYNECWWNCPNMSEGNIDGNTYLLYDLYRNGIIGVQFEETSMSLMEKIHIDIWASAAGSIKFRPITTGGPNTPKTLNLAAQQWNSFDIDLSEYVGHDWSKVFQFAIEGYQDGGLVGEHISVDNIFFYRTTPPPADETAPTDVIANKTEENFASVKLSAQANDDSGVVHFKVMNGLDVLVSDVEAVSGATVTITVNGLTPNTNYTLSVVASDEAGHEAEPVNVAVKTKALPSAAPQPTHVAEAVLSVYSDAYEPAVAAGFRRTNWGSAPVAIEDDYILYTMSANTIVWGNSDGNAGYGNIDGLSGYTHGETPGLDVSGMTYIHFDVWCDVADQLNTVNINDQAVDIPTTRTIAGQWVSFDVDITGVALADRQNVRWLKFHPFTNCNAAIDNVYFWKEPDFKRDASTGDDWMAPGELGTICIPNGAVATGGDIYELEGKNEVGKIVFATVPNNEMTPGKPYLFEAKSDAMNFYYTSAAPAGEPENSGAMKGTFAEVTLMGDQLNNVYYFAGHALWSCVDLTATGLHVSANRAWVVLDENMPTISTSNPAPGRRYIYMGVNGQNATTGFGEVQGDDQQSTKVLINGHLFIRRGEKTYDATGRLVK